MAFCLAKLLLFKFKFKLLENRKNNAKKKSKLKLAPIQPCSKTKKNS